MNSPMHAAMSAEVSATQANLLFVDDEMNILSALRRLFRPLGYTIFTAESGADALKIIESEKIDLIISDMRMPEMNGAQLLERVRNLSPDTIRILLTGYADIASTVDAINKGQIYRYISKPWEDNDIVITVRHALAQKELEREKNRLELLTKKQNEELKDLNANLEDKVRARTEEVRQTMGFLEVANGKLKRSFFTSIQIFSNLVELRENSMSGHSRKVANHARKLALKIGMSESEAQDVMIAGLLHDIGKIALPDYLLNKPFSSLNNEERGLVIKHPAVGQNALMSLEELSVPATYIRSHHERFDGLGFPDGLAGFAIPLGARVLVVVNDYESVQAGHILNKRYTPLEALNYIKEGRRSRYDPQVADAFIEMMTAKEDLSKEKEVELLSVDLKAGMVLSRDLIATDGCLLLCSGHLLNEKMIEQLRQYEKVNQQKLLTYVRTKS